MTKEAYFSYMHKVWLGILYPKCSILIIGYQNGSLFSAFAGVHMGRYFRVQMAHLHPFSRE